MDLATRRRLLSASMLGQTILASEDRAGERAFQQAAQQIRQQHPLSQERRKQLLRASPWGRSVLTYETEQSSGTPAGHIRL